MDEETEPLAGLPDWLTDIAPADEEQLTAWDAREAQRERALEALAHGLLVEDADAQAVGWRLLDAASAAGGAAWPHDAARPTALDAALAGEVDAAEMVSALRDDDASLTDDERSWAGGRPERLRLLALARHLDVGHESLAPTFLPDRTHGVVAVAARAGVNTGASIAAWLKQRPDLTEPFVSGV